MLQVQFQHFPEPTQKEAMRSYRKVFDIVNRECFNGELPPIEIARLQDLDPAEQQRVRESNALACFLYDSRHRDPPTICIVQDTETGITIDTIDILFHEMIHFYCYLHGIEDVYGRDQYHSFDFKRAVEKHGGKCFFAGILKGYAATHLPDETLWSIWERI